MKKVTLKEIAIKANTSLSSVSLVLNGNTTISEEVRSKVLSVAKELGYSKALPEKNKKLSVVALLLPVDEARAHSWNVFTRIIKSCEEMLVNDDYYPVIIPVNESMKNEYILKLILDLNVSGVLSIHYAEESFYDYLQAKKIPLVVINNSVFPHSAVLIDDFGGAYQACLKLIEHGHKNIVYFDYHREDLPNISYDRYLGYSKALLEFGLEERNVHIRLSLNDYNHMLENLKNCLAKKKNKATAIMVHDDYLGVHIYRALESLNYRIPEDVSLIATGGGVLDYDLSYTPQITCMELDTEKLGRVAGELLLSYMKNIPVSSSRLTLEQIYKERKTVNNISK